MKVFNDLVGGIPVHGISLPGVKDVALGIWIRAGTVDELLPEEAGIAHALEHMLFKGNKRFKTNKDITRVVEDVGGSINAFTFLEGTVYLSVVPSGHIGRAIDCMAPLVMDPLFREEDIEIEKGTIVQEIKRSLDDPSWVAYQTANQLIFGNHPYGRDIKGSVDSVSSFSVDDFRTFHSELYNKSNTTIFVVGNFEVGEVANLIDAHFSGWEVGSENIRRFSGVSRIHNFSLFKKREIEQAHLAMKAPLPGFSSREFTVMKVFAVMMDGGMSFPFFEELREKRGLCYSSSALVESMKENCIFEILVATEPERLDEASLVCLDTVYENRLNEDLLGRAKSVIRGKIERGSGKTEQVLEDLWYDVMKFGRFRPDEEVISDIESVSIGEIQSAVEKFLSPDNFVRAIVAPDY